MDYGDPDIGDRITDKDLFFHGGNIWWEEKGKFENGEMVIRDGIVSEIIYGSKLPSSARRGAEFVDMKGGYLCPSFIDAHMHLFQWSITKNGIDLSACRSAKEVMNRLRDVADGKVKNPLFNSLNALVGIDYDESFFEGHSHLEGSLLGSEFPDIPVVIRRICGHKAILNESGVDLLNIDTEMVQDGIVIDDIAMDIPWRLPFDNDQLSGFYYGGVRAMFSAGVTGGVDIIPSSQIPKFRSIFDPTMIEMDTSVAMIRDDDTAYSGPSLPKDWDDVPVQDQAVGNGPTLFFEKFYLDGSIGSRTASFTEDYADSPSVPPLYFEEEFNEKVKLSHDEGLIPMVHCIGDRAISRAVNVLEGFPYPYRLEHAESITKGIIERMTIGKGAICLQPNFQYTWGNKGGLYHSSLGETGLGLNRLKTISGSGHFWCFGTDMMPPDPLYGIKGAINHQITSERLSLFDAISGFTSKAEKLSCMQRETSNSSRVDSKADLVLFDRAQYRVMMTIKKGTLVFDGMKHMDVQTGVHHHSTNLK
jgi:predicted amidohydrolase YtcJ